MFITIVNHKTEFHHWIACVAYKQPEDCSAMAEDRPLTPEEEPAQEEPPKPEDMQVVKMEDVITIDPDATDVDLNHGRIGKIERLEPLVNLERYVNLIK